MEEERLELQSVNSSISYKAERLEADLQEVREELAGRRRQNEEDKERMLRYSEDLESALSGTRDLRRQLKTAQQQRGKAYRDEEKAIEENEALRTRLETRISELEASLV